MMIALVCGCGPDRPVARSGAAAELFAPVSMRIHPIFTDVKDFNGDGWPDGVEALLEFQDQFGDPTKAAGEVIFELFAFRPYHADPRGERVVNPWLASVNTLAEQKARWNRTSRTYSFQLEFPQVREEQSYVLTAAFDTGRTRFFDRVVLQGSNRAPEPPATRPGAIAASATQPASTRPVATPPAATTPAITPPSGTADDAARA